jgi:hypothetical protein
MRNEVVARAFRRIKKFQAAVPALAWQRLLVRALGLRNVRTDADANATNLQGTLIGGSCAAF